MVGECKDLRQCLTLWPVTWLCWPDARPDVQTQQPLLLLHITIINTITMLLRKQDQVHFWLNTDSAWELDLAAYLRPYYITIPLHVSFFSSFVTFPCIDLTISLFLEKTRPAMLIIMKYMQMFSGHRIETEDNKLGIVVILPKGVKKTQWKQIRNINIII